MSQKGFFRKYLISRIGGPFAKFAKISATKVNTKDIHTALKSHCGLSSLHSLWEFHLVKVYCIVH